MKRVPVEISLDGSLFVRTMSRWAAVQKMNPTRPDEDPFGYLRRIADIVDETWLDD
jgi:hypothetical protein